MSNWLGRLRPPEAPAPVLHGPESTLSRATDTTLEELIEWLAKWGQPCLCQMGSGGGWFCWVDVKVNATGVDFKVKGASNHATPLEAAVDCRDKLVTALKGLGVQA